MTTAGAHGWQAAQGIHDIIKDEIKSPRPRTSCQRSLRAVVIDCHCEVREGLLHISYGSPAE